MRSQHFEDSTLSILRNPEDHVEPKAEQDGPMANISKHDSKQEREGDNSEEPRIGLLIISNTIGLHNLLCRYGIAISDKMCRVFISISRHKLSNCMFGTIF